MESFYSAGPVESYVKQFFYLQRFKTNKRNRYEELTNREIEVLGLIAEGMRNSAIAEILEISGITVRNHRASIREKLNINSQTEYIKYALAFDLIQF